MSITDKYRVEEPRYLWYCSTKKYRKGDGTGTVEKWYRSTAVVPWYRATLVCTYVVKRYHQCYLLSSCREHLLLVVKQLGKTKVSDTDMFRSLDYRHIINIIHRHHSGVRTKSTLRGQGEAQRTETRNPKGWARAPGSYGEGAYCPSPPAIGGLRERCKLSLAAENFGAFWVLQMSCPAVLLCKTVCVCVMPLYRCTI